MTTLPHPQDTLLEDVRGTSCLRIRRSSTTTWPRTLKSVLILSLDPKTTPTWLAMN